jgi:hypothetical protein
MSKYYELGYAKEIDFGQGDAMRKKIRTLQQAPKNAGPINSHMLVLRSLELMCDTSPDYLDCFMSYAETLLCPDLGEKEKAEKDKPATSKKSSAKKAAKK